MFRRGTILMRLRDAVRIEAHLRGNSAVLTPQPVATFVNCGLGGRREDPPTMVVRRDASAREDLPCVSAVGSARLQLPPTLAADSSPSGSAGQPAELETSCAEIAREATRSPVGTHATEAASSDVSAGASGGGAVAAASDVRGRRSGGTTSGALADPGAMAADGGGGGGGGVGVGDAGVAAADAAGEGVAEAAATICSNAHEPPPVPLRVGSAEWVAAGLDCGHRTWIC
jgi:hypothetical protein